MATKKKKKTTPAMDLAIRGLKGYRTISLWAASKAYGTTTINALIHRGLVETYRPDNAPTLVRLVTDRSEKHEN